MPNNAKVFIPPKFTQLILRPHIGGVLQVAVKKAGILNIDALKNAFSDLVADQEAMHALYKIVDGSCEMTLIDPKSVPVSIKSFVDIDADPKIFSGLNIDANFVESLMELVEVNPPRYEPPYLDIYSFSNGLDSLLVINAWHSVFDGPSIGIIQRTIEERYSFYTRGGVETVSSAMKYSDYFIWLNKMRDIDKENKLITKIKSDKELIKRADDILERLSSGAGSQDVVSCRNLLQFISSHESAKIAESCSSMNISTSSFWQACFMVSSQKFRPSVAFEYCYLTDLRPSSDYRGTVGFFGSNAMQKLTISIDDDFRGIARRININNIKTIGESLKSEWLPADVYSRLRLSSVTDVFSYQGEHDFSEFILNTQVDNREDESTRYFSKSSLRSAFLSTFNVVVLRVMKYGSRFLLVIEHSESNTELAEKISNDLQVISSAASEKSGLITVEQALSLIGHRGFSSAELV